MNPGVLTVFKSPFKKIRLGKEYDGGYIICEIPDVNYDVIIAGGIENDTSFEEDFVNKYQNTKAYLFDGTVSKLPTENDKFTFVKKNIGFNNNNSETNMHDIINQNNSIFVKMDIEGGEIPWIQSLRDEQLDKFEQIVMEFHHPFSEKENFVFNKINQHHYLVHFHANNCCGVRNHYGVKIPNIFECTYLHKKHFKTPPQVNSDLIPSDIDMKNVKESPEIHINYPPFVYLKR